MDKKQIEGKSIREIEKLVDRYGGKLKVSLTKLRDGLSKETDETREMLEIYYKYTNGTASEADLAKANEQFRDVIKALGLGIFLILPAAPITIPFFVKLAQMVGIELLPSSFRSKPVDTDEPKESN